MSLSDLGSLGEFFGALGVIGSLVYLGLQIHQNTRALKASSNHALNDSFSAFLTLLVQTPEAERIMAEGVTDLERLSPEERSTFYSLLGILFGNFENAFFHYQQGMMDDAQWHRWRIAIGWYVGFPGVARWWTNRKVVASDEFRALVERESARMGPSDPATWAPSADLELSAVVPPGSAELSS